MLGLMVAGVAIVSVLQPRDTRLVGGYMQNDLGGSNQAITGPGVTVFSVTAYAVEAQSILVESKPYRSPQELSRSRGLWPCRYGVIDTPSHTVFWVAPESPAYRRIRVRLKVHGTVILGRSCIGS